MTPIPEAYQKIGLPDYAQKAIEGIDDLSALQAYRSVIVERLDRIQSGLFELGFGANKPLSHFVRMGQGYAELRAIEQRIESFAERNRETEIR